MKAYIWRIVKTIISAVLGIFILRWINIFDYIPLVPRDKAFDLGVIVYFSVIELILDIIISFIKESAISNLSAIISLNDNEGTIDSKPIIQFNNLDLAEANITIKIEGKKKHFSDWNLILPSTKFATVQLNKQTNFASIDNDGNLLIPIEAIFGTSDLKTSMEFGIKIVFAKEDDDVATVEISLELKNKKSKQWPRRIIFKRNKAILKLER